MQRPVICEEHQASPLFLAAFARDYNRDSPLPTTVMRLSSHECRMIREAVAPRFGSGARVWLFGSRADDNARGGDIDLLVEAPEPLEGAFAATVGLETDLQMALDDQKIDIILLHPGIKEAPLHRIAKGTGVLL